MNEDYGGIHEFEATRVKKSTVGVGTDIVNYQHDVNGPQRYRGQELHEDAEQHNGLVTFALTPIVPATAVGPGEFTTLHSTGKLTADAESEFKGKARLSGSGLAWRSEYFSASELGWYSAANAQIIGGTYFIDQTVWATTNYFRRSWSAPSDWLTGTGIYIQLFIATGGTDTTPGHTFNIRSEWVAQGTAFGTSLNQDITITPTGVAKVLMVGESTIINPPGTPGLNSACILTVRRGDTNSDDPWVLGIKIWYQADSLGSVSRTSKE